MLVRLGCVIYGIAIGALASYGYLGFMKESRLKDALSECVHYHLTLSEREIMGLSSSDHNAVLERCGKGAI